MAVVADVLDTEAAVEEVVRAALRAIAKAGDQDALTPESQTAVSAVMLNLIADAAQPIPTRTRIPMIASAHDLIDQFLSACIAEAA